MDLISVIVPVYKVEPYLDRCVQSIVDQTFRNLEIILVDDGSPDNCGAMCDAWAEKDSRIKVIHKENGGLSDARNAGMAVATGQYIAFVDSDDWIAPDYISAMLYAILSHHAQLAACDVLFVEDDASLSPKITASPSVRICTPEQALENLIHGCGFRAVAWNKLYHRSLLQDVSFPVGRHHEDEFITYKLLARAEKLIYIEAPLYFYLQRPGSIMRTLSIKRLDALDAYLERHELFRQHFPRLYTQDKVSFCISCAAFYTTALSQQFSDRQQFKEKIIRLRRQISFSFSELLTLRPKQLVYVLGTGCSIDLFCRILHLRKGGNS